MCEGDGVKIFPLLKISFTLPNQKNGEKKLLFDFKTIE